MHSHYRFSELSESLRNGFLADEIVLASAKTQRLGKVLDPERKVFERAVYVLDLALKGHEWLDNPKLTNNTSASASFFGQAVKALPEVYTSAGFLEHLAELRHTADELAEGKLPEQARIAELRTFFFNTSQTELDRTEQLVDGEQTTNFLEWKALAY